MLLKCCTQCQHIWKTPHDHRTSKGQFSFQFHRREMSENVENYHTIALIPYASILSSLCSKSFKLVFSNTWTKKFQMYKMDLEKAEEPEIKLPISVGSERQQTNSRKIPTLHFLPLKWDHLHICRGCCISPGNLDSSLAFHMMCSA